MGKLASSEREYRRLWVCVNVNDSKQRWIIGVRWVSGSKALCWRAKLKQVSLEHAPATQRCKHKLKIKTCAVASLSSLSPFPPLLSYLCEIIESSRCKRMRKGRRDSDRMLVGSPGGDDSKQQSPRKSRCHRPSQDRQAGAVSCTLLHLGVHGAVIFLRCRKEVRQNKNRDVEGETGGKQARRSIRRGGGGEALDRCTLAEMQGERLKARWRRGMDDQNAVAIRGVQKGAVHDRQTETDRDVVGKAHLLKVLSSPFSAWTDHMCGVRL